MSIKEIYEKYKDERLTKEELIFLYKFDYNTDFLYDEYEEEYDMYQEMKNSRNFKEDVMTIFGCEKSEISKKKEDILNGKEIKCFIGNLDLEELTTLENIKLPYIILGSLRLSNIKSLDGIILPKYIMGSLFLNNVEIIKNTTFPDVVLFNIFLNNTQVLENVKLLTKINGILYFEKLKEIYNTQFIEDIENILDSDNKEYIKTIISYKH